MYFSDYRPKRTILQVDVVWVEDGLTPVPSTPPRQGGTSRRVCGTRVPFRSRPVVHTDVRVTTKKNHLYIRTRGAKVVFLSLLSVRFPPTLIEKKEVTTGTTVTDGPGRPRLKRREQKDVYRDTQTLSLVYELCTEPQKE